MYLLDIFFTNNIKSNEDFYTQLLYVYNNSAEEQSDYWRSIFAWSVVKAVYELHDVMCTGTYIKDQGNNEKAKTGE